MKDLWTPSEELLMWVLLMGAHGAKNKPERPWYVLQLARCFERLGYADLVETSEALKGYFYLDRIHGNSLEVLWKETEILRAMLRET
jgi:hypothetical protein